MNYEKKYNEALNWMRELYPGLHGATKEDAEHYFPELAESEDERIRKAIIAGIKRCADAGSIFGTVIHEEGVSYHKVLAWLEKQKESNIDKLRRISTPASENWLEVQKQWEEEDKQAEQQPAEWSKEDERHLIWLCRIIHNRVVNKELSLAEESELGKWIDKWINHKPQPVQKWDDFDEDCLKRAIWYVENPAPSVVKDTNLVLWLKSLRPQPHWKPSEEQLVTLLRAEGIVRVHDTKELAAAIAELYEELKKRM